MADESTCKKLNIPEVVVTAGRFKPGAPCQTRLVTASQTQTSQLNIHNKNHNSPEDSINDQAILVISFDS